jgi:hypothetical protein
MHVPCDAENMAWVKASLAKTSSRIRVFNVDEADRSEEEGSAETTKSSNGLIVDWNVEGAL